jgi:hypothetical protein
MTRSPSCVIHKFIPGIQSVEQLERDQSIYVRRFARLYKASSLLDQMLSILNSPTGDRVVDEKALLAAIQPSVNLQIALEVEPAEGHHHCGGGISLCHT